MSNSLAEEYLRWLAPQIREETDGNPNRTYWDLIHLMFEKRFVDAELIANDHNRIEDGLALRVEFCHERNIPPEASTGLGPCSFLEVLIGLSRRLSFMAGGAPAGWAWVLVSNLELHRVPDPIGRGRARKVDSIMDDCIHRNYSPDGQGGFFPLAYPEEDQTRVELWYQLGLYVNELNPEHH